MKLLHIADLHIGKRVNEFNLIPDQQYILDQIIQIISHEKPSGVLIAGDVYDRSQPSNEAVEVLDEFLTKLARLGQRVFIISGNHDSPQRLGFGSRIMERNRVHIAGVFKGAVEKVTLTDDFGPVNIYLLPFIKPAFVRPFFPETSIETYHQAVATVIEEAKINPEERNVLIAHQFVVGRGIEPQLSDSESLSIGGIDSVDAEILQPFDYVALGHLHRAQSVGSDTIRYAGSPLKYSLSEVQNKKFVTIAELKEKGDCTIRLEPLQPLKDMRKIEGPIDELIKSGQKDPRGASDYIHATLTDEEEVYDAIGRLRRVYPNLMSLDFANSRTNVEVATPRLTSEKMANQSPLELFQKFYEIQNNRDLNEKQIKLLEQIFHKAGGAN